MLDLLGGLAIVMFMVPMMGLGFAVIDDIMLDNVVGEHLTKKLRKKLKKKLKKLIIFPAKKKLMPKKQMNR